MEQSKGLDPSEVAQLLKKREGREIKNLYSWFVKFKFYFCRRVPNEQSSAPVDSSTEVGDRPQSARSLSSTGSLEEQIPQLPKSQIPKTPSRVI
jgi:hypothetical protein